MQTMCQHCKSKPRRPKSANGKTPLYCSDRCAKLAWFAENPEKARQYARARDPEKRKAQSRASYARHPDRHRRKQRLKLGIKDATGEAKSGPCEMPGCP